MKAIIVCVSVSHGNTRRVAEEIGRGIEAPVVHPDELETRELAAYELVGFGSGIFNLDFHPRLRTFVRALPEQRRRSAFVFATRGFPEPRVRPYTRRLTRALEAKRFEVVGTFSCRGFDTWLPLRLIGGTGKGRPDAADLDAARTFADMLRNRVGTAY